MKSYKELAGIMEEKIMLAMPYKEQYAQNIGHMIDTWISFSERDKETPEAEKKAKAEKMISYIENCLVSLNPQEKEAYWAFSMSLTYIGLRQMIEPPQEDEKEAHLYHVQV